MPKTKAKNDSSQQRGGMMTRDGGMGLLFRSSTANAEDRTVELVWAAGEVVRRHGPLPDGSGWGAYDEDLSLDGDAVDLSRMNTGAAPILDAHYRYSMADQLGVVVAGSASVQNGEGVCLAKYRTTPEADAVFQSILDETVRNVSVGYSVQKFEVYREEGQVPLFRAVKWMPKEVSMVPIGADPGAGVREDAGSQTPPEIVEIKRGDDMPDKAKQADQTASNGTDQAANPASNVRSEQPSAPAAVASVQTVDEDAIRSEAAKAERERIDTINKASRILGDGARAVADDLIARGVGVDAARAAILDKAAEVSDAAVITGHRISGGDDNTDPAVMRGRMAEAISCRHSGADLSEQARDFAGLSLLDCGRELLDARGERTRGLRGPDLYERAMGTSDFPILLQGVGDRLLLPSYQAAPATYQAIARKVTNRDFRARALVRDGDFPELEKLNEHGEFKHGAMSESQETIKLESVGRRLKLTRHAIINDDLGAFSDLATKAGVAARRFENQKVWSVVTGGIKMSSDNKALFHADHKNIAAAGAAIAAASVGLGKKSIRTRKSADGNPLNYTPSVIVVPAALETVVEQYLSDVVVPTTTGDVVPGSHKKLTPIVEPLLDASSETAWYLFTDPRLLASIVYSYLEGMEGPQLRQEEIGLSGIDFDVLLDFNAAPVEHRGSWKNPGA